MHLFKKMLGTRTARAGWLALIGLLAAGWGTGGDDPANPGHPLYFIGGLVLLLLATYLLILNERAEARHQQRIERNADIPPTEHDLLVEFDRDLHNRVYRSPRD